MTETIFSENGNRKAVIRPHNYVNRYEIVLTESRRLGSSERTRYADSKKAARVLARKWVRR